MSATTDSATDASAPTPKPALSDESDAEIVGEAVAVDDIDLDHHPDNADTDEAPADESAARTRTRPQWKPVITYGILPATVFVLILGAAYGKWQATTLTDAQHAASQSVQAATESTIALLSYRPDTVEKQLTEARTHLTGSFRDAYTSLTHDVVIPGAQQKHISAVATVPAAGSLSATENHAAVLVFVDQTTTVGNDTPTNTSSSVRVTLDKVDDRWLISAFDPV
ncbi:MAG: Mce-associated rane protein [Mycobacterium sp.]|nr:Mce-associated rane protein [Mycobacterium sp.]